MIKRLFSLLAGIAMMLVLYALCARAVLDTSAADLVLRAASGTAGFFGAAVPAAACFLVIHLFLSRIFLFKRGWASAGALAAALALCLFALILFGGSLT